MFGSAYLWFGGGVLAFFMTLSLSPASLVTDGNSLIIVIIVFPESRIYDMPSAVNRETLAMAAQDCGQDDEEELISQTNLSHFVSPEDISKWIHHTQGGPTPKHRFEFFKDIPCSLLVRLTKHFLMDLEMFDYKTDEFMKICKYY